MHTWWIFSASCSVLFIFRKGFFIATKKTFFLNTKRLHSKGQLRLFSFRDFKKHRSSPKIDFSYYGTFLITSLLYARENLTIKEHWWRTAISWRKAFLFFPYSNTRMHNSRLRFTRASLFILHMFTGSSD